MLLYEHISSNKKKSVILIVLFYIILSILGMAVGILLFEDIFTGIIISNIVTMIYIFISINNAEGIILKMNHARPISKEENPFLYNTVENLALVARVPVPKIYIIKEDSPNAFAAGISQKRSVIAVTTALLDKLNREEVEAVLAHEMAHIANQDIKVSTISIALLSAILIISDIAVRIRMKDSDDIPPQLLALGVIFIIISPLIAYIIHFAISRNREYLADATGAEFTRNPRALASALAKIDSDPDIVDNISPSCASLYIADPLKKHFDKNGKRKKKKKNNLFSTHPVTEDRINRLINM